MTASRSDIAPKHHIPLVIIHNACIHTPLTLGICVVYILCEQCSAMCVGVSASHNNTKQTHCHWNTFYEEVTGKGGRGRGGGCLYVPVNGFPLRCSLLGGW